MTAAQSGVAELVPPIATVSGTPGTRETTVGKFVLKAARSGTPRPEALKPEILKNDCGT
jgi:hypothetical protein